MLQRKKKFNMSESTKENKVEPKTASNRKLSQIEKKKICLV